MLLFPNCKINLGLNIVGVRPNGYHDLETVFYPLALADVLEIVFPENQTQEYVWQSSGIALDIPEEKNLCIKALKLLKREYTIPPVAMHLRKNVPFGAGLGGGSSDAASVITGLNMLLHLGMSTEKMCSIAAQIGADCPFFIINKPMAAEGIGEILKPINIYLKGRKILLVKPDVSMSTAEAYAQIECNKPELGPADWVVTNIVNWKRRLTNDFEKPVFARFPQLAQIKEQLYASGATYVAMSGSGTAIYAIFDTTIPQHLKFADCFVWSGELAY
ncbi:MAG: 4-(cytidine 5'-diphospho)-2-C-methyl-D-erythritol kinase [Marinilabiliaceae bacterium]|nr:4-(cytidine 5'-diphospho)-2-C-methyl-D-erythritol kinase [Marinilabiliaceae bacterium]